MTTFRHDPDRIQVRWPLAPLAGWYLRARMARELADLDDRVLADIGLTRGQIPEVAEIAYREKIAEARRVAREWLVGLLPKWVIRWYKRNKLYNEMVALSDYMLADIGLSRYEIPRVVHEAYRDQPETVQAPAPERAPVNALAPVTGRIPANDTHHKLAA